MIDGRIILNHSQVSLKQIQIPVYHIEMGCQLDIYDLKDQQYITMQGECPVCLKDGHFKFDQKAFESQRQMQTKQFIELSNKLYQQTKSPYPQFCLSEFQDIFQLQQQFNTHQLIGQNYVLQNKESIEQIAIERNQSFFEIIKFIQNKKPLLYGILNYKLILFYDSQKIKIELNLYNQTIQQYMNYSNSGIVKQVLLHENFIYLIVEKRKIHQLYRGKFSLCFEQDFPVCCVYEMPGYTMVGETKLFQVKDKLSMIGIYGYINIEQEFMDGIKMIETNFISNLKYKPQIAQFSNQIYLIYTKQQENQKFNYIQKIKIEEVDFEKKIQKYEQKLSYNNPFDSILTCGDYIYLIKISQLNGQKYQSQFYSIKQSNSLMETFEINNHHTYLEVVEIPSSQEQVIQVNCKLVGLKLKGENNDELILPGLLVINPLTKIIEIELL